MTPRPPWCVPDTWEWVQIGDVAEVVGGGTPRTAEASNFDDGAIAWVTPADLSGYKAKYIERGSRNITSVGLRNSGARVLPKGSVLFSSRAPIGYVAIARNPLATNQGFKSFVLPDDLDPEYVYYYLQRAKGLALALASGTTFQEVSGRQAAKIPLPIAPIQEQHRIVEAIESYFTRLDDAVATLERVQRNLTRYRASVLKAAVEGRLVPTEAELARAEGRDYEAASVLLERVLAERRRRWEEAELAKMKAKGKVPKDDGWKAKYEEAVGPDTTDLPELSEGWCWASIDQLAATEDHALCDGPFGSNLKTSHYTVNGPRVIRLQNIGEGVFIDARAHIAADHYRRLQKHAVSAGDVIVASLGQDLPRACMVPELLGKAIVKADCLRFAVHRSLMLPQFAMHALNSPMARKHAEDLIHGVGRPRIGLTLLRTFPLPLPPLAEQTRIVAAVERMQSVELELTSVAGASLTRLDHLRQSILKWAFEGRLVDQDPTDEPASKLLKRIKSERASELGRSPTPHPRRTASKGKAS